MFAIPIDATPKEVDERRNARLLYWMGWPVAEIAAHLGKPISTVSSWKTRDGWDETAPIQRVETCIEAKLIQLVMKEPKSGADVRDIDLLTRQVERLARVRRYAEPGGHEGDLNQKVADRNLAAGRKSAAKRSLPNEYSEEQAAQIEDAFKESLLGHQRLWLASSNLRTRAILKSRQTGATWYFAREALVDAILTGRNQIFLSASKNQAHVFRQYIVAFAREAAGLDLKGDPIVLPNGAHLYFLGTNARTAQGYHGNFYFDEFFWTHRFAELNKVASGMATHKKWRRTYFSTPSSINHEAYPFWTGEAWNRRRPKAERQTIDVSHVALQGGALGQDRMWRQILTIDDAIAAGMDLFDREELEAEYAPGDFANLFLCEFVDDTLSIFPLSMLQGAMVDAYEAWEDFSAHLERPFGDAPVWIGYDPSFTGDKAAISVISAPVKAGDKFRLLERQRHSGLDFAGQAAAVKRLTERYRVTNIGVDATGMGLGVYQLVQQFFPQARSITYSPEVKNRMVLKALDVMRKGRFEFDRGLTDVAASFMAIRRTLTGSQRQLTYESGRNAETGHADVAWSIMHAFDFEPLEAGMGGGRGGFMEIF